MEFDREGEFERIMEEIFPVSIPAQFVKKLVVKLNTGHDVVLTGEELLHPLPVANDLSWDKLIEQFDRIDDIEVFIDMKAIQNGVAKNVKEILSAHFKERNVIKGDSDDPSDSSSG